MAKLLNICFLTCAFIGCNSLSETEWNLHHLDLDLDEETYPSPYPTPFQDHPRNTPPPTVSPKPTTRLPTASPSSSPTKRPSHEPTPSPSIDPAVAPTRYPTGYPSRRPSLKPTPFPSLPNHMGSQPPTPHPTLPRGSLAMDYILFGASVTLADMMVITATIWGAIFVMGLTYMYRSSVLGESPGIRLDEDMSTHSDISNSTHSEYQDSSTRGMMSHQGGSSASQQPFQPSAARNPMQTQQSPSGKPPSSAMDAASSLSKFTAVFQDDDDEEEVDVSLRSSVFTRPPAPPSTTQSGQPSVPSASGQLSSAASTESVVTPSSLSIGTAPIPMPDEEDDSLPL